MQLSSLSLSAAEYIITDIEPSSCVLVNGTNSSALATNTIPHWSHGVYEDGVQIRFDDDWCFPYGIDHLASVEVMSYGAVLPNGFTTNTIASFANRLSMIPNVSEFRYGRTESNSYEFVWLNAHDARINGNEFTGSIELKRNGDVDIVTTDATNTIPYAIPFAHDGFGQDEEWVRANFTNAEEIIASGYDNWVAAQVGSGLTNGLCVLTATFNTVPEEPTRLIVGDFSLCVTNSGSYSFVLEKGISYKFGTWPFDEKVQYSYADDISSVRRGLRMAAVWNGSGIWSSDGGDVFITLPTVAALGDFMWRPTLRGYPDVVHIGPEDCPVSFTAFLSDVGPSVEMPEFLWTASEDVRLSSRTDRTVSVICGAFPSWSEITLDVSTRISGFELTSSLTFTYGEYETPQTRLGVSMPSQLLLIDDWLEGSESAKAIVELSSDIDTNGAIRVSVINGSDKISSGENGIGSHSFSNSKEYSLTFPIDGIAASGSCDDVELLFEYVDASGAVADSVSNKLTVVSPKRISINDDAVQDVAVLIGSSINFRIVTEPSAAAIPSVNWYDAKLRADRTYTGWREWEQTGCAISREMDESGIFIVKARAVFPGPQWTDALYTWTEDEPQAIGNHHRGDANHIGVASTQAQLNLRSAARSMLGNTDYAKGANLPARNSFSKSPADSWKCNAFVADTAIAAGLKVPVLHEIGILSVSRYPPLANEWANGTPTISGWTYLGIYVWPEPGLVVGHPSQIGSGHVGIVDYDGEGIAAGTTKVNRRYHKFLDGTSGYNKYTGDDNEQNEK